MKKKFIIPLLILGMSIGACQKPDDGPENETQTPESGSQNPEGGETNPTYTIDIPSSEDTSPVLGTEGGSVVLNFSTSAEWTANVINTRADSWIDVSPQSGSTGAAKITITVEPNDTYDERSATVQIKCGSAEKNIVVTQKQKDALTVTKSRFDIPAEGGEVTIEVNSNISYDYAIDAEGAKWIKEAQTRALSTTTLQFVIDENAEVEKREGSITISSGDLEETIKIYQEGAEPTLIVSQNEYTIAAEGETIQVEVESNMDVDVDIPVDWVKETQTKAVSTNTYYFTIEPNNTFESRETTITFTSKNTSDQECVRIIQEGAELLTVHVSNKGGLEAALSGFDLNTIKSLKISGVLNDIDFLCIRGMENLRSLDIANVEITSLPNRAFYETKNVENIILPNTLTVIKSFDFYQSNLITVYIPKNIEIIEETSFTFSHLTTVTFEKGSQLKTIGGGHYLGYDYGAFSNCSSLTSIEIPASVETIEAAAFKGCSKLTTVTFEKGSRLKTIGGGYNVFYDYGAFSNCSSLTSIEIPASVETIEAAAFKGCSKLTTVTFEKGSQLKTIGGGYYSKYDYYGVFSDCSSLTSIEIPASVETIEAAAFKGCSKLTTVTFEKGSRLKTIGGGYHSGFYYYGAFSDCSSLTSIEIPASVETIEAAAFKGCSKLTTVTFEKGSQLKSIEGEPSSNEYHGAFCQLNNLKTVDMSECKQVESLGSAAFSKCQNLSLFLLGTEAPPKCDYSWAAFSGISSYSVLKVPSGSVDAYKAAPGWKNFSSITALDE